ncbi:hypothetical protein [Alishewanella tabrizica]|uniref:hypothetical protein n=1 Tax=Alishewanella tabrizica TaxID=671278 RepID=UPI001676BE13|nr:hypothetical protein [Alishewanella tabrizica]
MLSTLVKRQKIWTVPLLISLAFSWCLLLCQNLAQAAPASIDSLQSSQTTTTPSCHSQQPTVLEHQVESKGEFTHLLITEHCSGCDNQAATPDAISLAMVGLLVSWASLPDAIIPASTIPVIALTTPPPRTAVPLYLAKNLLLI